MRPLSVISSISLLAFSAPPLFAQLIGGVWESFRDTPTGTPTTLAVLDDFDGDGIVDYAVGRYNEKRVDVRSGATGNLIYTIQHPLNPQMFGQAICNPGDVDGDGFGDILIGAPAATITLSTQGGVFLYSGLNGGPLLEAYGSNADDRLGSTVAFTGDLNGDGVFDFLVGANRASFPSRGNPGAAYVLSGVDGSVLMFWGGVNDGDGFGTSVLSAGDLNGDGTQDVLIGAPNANGSSSSEGTVDAYSGVTGVLLWQRRGIFGDYFGRSLGTNGDLTGDGVADIFVGESSGLKVNLISGATGSQLAEILPPSPGQSFGLYLGTGQDIDGDGILDLAISAHSGNKVYVSSGKDGQLFQEVIHDPAASWLGMGMCAINDLDSDGRGDLLVSSYNNAYGFRFALGIEASPNQVSASSGGTVDFLIDFPPSEGGLQYILLGSLNGTGPTSLFGLEVPLTEDSFFTSMLHFQAPLYFSGEFGVLNMAGDAVAHLTFLPSEASAFVGRTGFFAAVSYSPPTTPRLTSVASTVTVTP